MENNRLLFELCGSLTMADHLGDVAEDIFYALEKAGVDTKGWDDFEDLKKWLGKNKITTLYGTYFEFEDEEEDV